MKSRREFQLIHGYRHSPDKPVQPRAALTRGIPYNTSESIPRLLREQVEDSLTAALTAFVACRYWPRGGRAYVAAVLFPVAVALTGAIIVNRYDVVVLDPPAFR